MALRRDSEVMCALLLVDIGRIQEGKVDLPIWKVIYNLSRTSKGILLAFKSQRSQYWGKIKGYIRVKRKIKYFEEKPETLKI